MDKPVLPRIYLSPPHMSGEELEFVKHAFASNWIAPLGPQVDAFEAEMAEYVGVSHAAALASGTAGIHLALRLLDVQPGDEVLCSTLTFSATANPVLYEHAQPVFIDCGAASWNIDPALLREELDACARRGRLPRAVIIVDLYGEPADYHEIEKSCSHYEVPTIQDAAEALGAKYDGRRAGAHGQIGRDGCRGAHVEVRTLPMRNVRPIRLAPLLVACQVGSWRKQLSRSNHARSTLS